MTTLEILQQIVDGSNEGLAKCYDHPNSNTSNMGVAKLIQSYLNAANAAILELHKGNVK